MSVCARRTAVANCVRAHAVVVMSNARKRQREAAAAGDSAHEAPEARPTQRARTEADAGAEAEPEAEAVTASSRKRHREEHTTAAAASASDGGNRPARRRRVGIPRHRKRRRDDETDDSTSDARRARVDVQVASYTPPRSHRAVVRYEKGPLSVAGAPPSTLLGAAAVAGGGAAAAATGLAARVARAVPVAAPPERIDARSAVLDYTDLVGAVLTRARIVASQYIINDASLHGGPSQLLPPPSGLISLIRVLYALNQQVTVPALAQRRMIDVMMQSSAPQIMRDVWPMHQRALCRILGMERDMLQMNVNAPRRNGKSYALAKFIAACMWACPGRRMLLVAATTTPAEELVALVVREFMALPDAADRIVGSVSKLQFTVSGEGAFDAIHEASGMCTDASLVDTMLRGVSGRPAAIAGVKGQRADWVFCEEAARISNEFSEEVLVPLRGVRFTPTISISTPWGELSMFTTSATLRRPDGSLMYTTVNFELRCPACRARGAEECPMRAFWRPPWMSAAALADITTLAAEGDSTMAQEVMGESVRKSTSMFPSEWVLAATRFPRVKWPERVEYVYMSVDPSGGAPPGAKSGSHFAIVSAFPVWSPQCPFNFWWVVRLLLLLLLLPPPRAGRVGCGWMSSRARTRNG